MNYSTKIEIEILVKQFRNQTLEASKWTHEAHLTAGVWFLKNYNIYEATCYLRSGIIRHNAAVGGENTPKGGYHETLTLFWIQIIWVFIQKHQDKGILDVTNAFLLDKMSNKTLPFEYYTKDYLFTTRSRSIWVFPNLKPFKYCF